MTYSPNANWTAKIADPHTAPNYYLSIDGVAADYAVTPVKGQSTTQLMNVPSASASVLDVLAGTRTVQQVTVDLVDVGEVITALVGTDDPAAEVPTLINREVTLYGGYRDLDGADYAPIFVGLINDVQLVDGLTTYRIKAADRSYMLEGKLCTDATEVAPAIIEGNVANVFWALCTGTFSTSHPTYPLTFVSNGVTDPDASADFSTHVAWSDKANAYDNDDSTFAFGTASSAPNPASVVYSFPGSGEVSGRLRYNARVTGGTSGASLDVYYSTDAGSNWTLIEQLTNGDFAVSSSPILHRVEIGDLRVRFSAVLESTGAVAEVDFSSSVPTGLSIPTTEFADTQITDERDTWHEDDTVRVVLQEPTSAREYLETELFRNFACFAPIRGDGKLGLKFHVPAVPLSSAPTIVEDDIVDVVSWQRLLRDHLNDFVVRGDWNPDAESGADAYTDLYNDDRPEDTQNRTDTNETIEYRVESKWIRSGTFGGEEIAEELARRWAIRYLQTPARLVLEVPFTKRDLEQGDVALVTHSKLPNLLTGTRGIEAKPMLILSIETDARRGTLKVTLLDTGFRRYAGIAENSTPDYASATVTQRESEFFISDAASSDQFSNGDEGMRLA